MGVVESEQRIMDCNGTEMTRTRTSRSLLTVQVCSAHKRQESGIEHNEPNSRSEQWV